MPFEEVPAPAPLPHRLAGRLSRALARFDRTRPEPVAPRDPVLAAYLNEQLSAATALVEDLRRAAREPSLAPERGVLLRLRGDVAADRATVRAAMTRLAVPTDWTGLGLTWVSGRAAGSLSRLPGVRPVVGRPPTSAPAREAPVAGLLALEELLGALHRRAVAARVLRDLVGEAGSGWARAVHDLPPRAQAQLALAEAAHRRCAAPLLDRG